MLIYAVIAFAAAAIGGLGIFVVRLKNKKAPLPIALVHGAVAATGLVLLLLAIVNENAGKTAQIALALFLVAALGGFVLFSYRFRGKLIPIPLILVHALAAVAGFATLLSTVIA